MTQVYVGDIVFGSTNDDLAKSFAKEMKKILEMSMVGELTYFLGLQVKQTNKGIYINQAKYAKNLVKQFGLENVAHARTPMSTSAKLGIANWELIHQVSLLALLYIEVQLVVCYILLLVVLIYLLVLSIC